MYAEYHPWPWQRLDGLSDRFIDGLCALMQRGNYRMRTLTLTPSPNPNPNPSPNPKP